jgi:hypothetical protein
VIVHNNKILKINRSNRFLIGLNFLNGQRKKLKKLISQILPIEYKRQHQILWYTTKFLVVISVFFFFIFYTHLFDPRVQNQIRYQKESHITAKNMFLYLNSSNNNETEPGDEEPDEDYCMVKLIPNLTDHCGYVLNHTDDCNKFLIINYCVFPSIWMKPIYYILLVTNL